MPDPLLQTMHEWQNFYLLAGTASATLMGLMYLAVSLGAHLVPSYEHEVRTFVTPTLVHFTLVLLIAASMLIPVHSVNSLSIALAVIGVTSTAYSLQIILLLRRGAADPVKAVHWIWHAMLPLTSYVAIIGVAAWLYSGSSAALDGLAGSSVLLLIVGIHNAWDLVLWLARNRERK